MTNTPNPPSHLDYRAALHAIDTMTAPCPDDAPIRNDHPHDHFNRALRDLLIDRDTPTDDDAPAYAFDTMRALLATIDAYPYSRDDLTRLALDASLCPLHFIDYAICFDDDDDECLAIRMIHPSHDT
jgi:hypothetical protein